MKKELKPTNLIAVEVPKSAMKYILASYNNNGYYSNDLYYATTESLFNNVCFPASESKIKILGEVTKDKIGFDVEPYVEKLNGGSYADYEHGGNVLKIRSLNKEESFYSLLAANGLYFENPEGKSYPYRFAESDGTLQTLDWHRNKWKEFEESLIKGKLLILEKC